VRTPGGQRKKKKKMEERERERHGLWNGLERWSVLCKGNRESANTG